MAAALDVKTCPFNSSQKKKEVSINTVLNWYRVIIIEVKMSQCDESSCQNELVNIKLSQWESK